MSSGLGYTYKLQIDFGHAGDYSHALADVTARLRMDWMLTLGFQNPYAQIAPPSNFNFFLYNGDKALSPENTLGAYYGLLKRGTLVKITASYNATVYQTWIGKIEKILPAVNPNVNMSQNGVVTVVCEDFTNELMNTQIFPVLQTDVLVHEALEVIMEEAALNVVLPYESSWALVDVSLVDTARVPNSDIFTTDTMTTVIPFVGDNSSDALNTVGVQSIVKDIMGIEDGGRFFYNGEQFEAQGRYHAADASLVDPALTLLAIDIEEVRYTEGDDLANDITVTYQPREVGTPSSIIYSAESEIAINAGQAYSRRVHFRDATTPTARIGATDIVPLVSGVDYIANSVTGGAGVDITSFVFASHQNSAQSTSITIVNTASITAYITTLQIRGTPLRTYERETVKAVDAQSVADNRRRPKTYVYKLVSDEEMAQGLANIQVARFKDPIARFATITYLANSNSKLITYSPTVGDIIRVSEQTSTKHARDYTLTGYVVRVNKENPHRITLTLSPIAREKWWLLGVSGSSELGSTAIIAI